MFVLLIYVGDRSVKFTVSQKQQRLTLQFDGVVTTYLNDAINRLTGQQSLNAYATFVYDVLANTLVKWQQGSPQITMTYDAASRLVTQLYGASTILETYNQAGSRTSQSADGAITGYVYDGENQLTKVTNPDFTIVTSTYSGDGLRRAYQQPGKNVYTQVWDGSNLIGEVQA